MDLKRKADVLEAHQHQQALVSVATERYLFSEANNQEPSTPLNKRTNTGHEETCSDRSKRTATETSLTSNTFSLAIPDLRYASETWRGAKETNEDRHINMFDRLPGALFGIFDGHGGCFTADFLVRNLAKNLTSTLRQRGLKENEILSLLATSQEELLRRTEILRETESFQKQKDQLCEIESQSGDEELRTMIEQLETTISDMTQAIDTIDLEEKGRRDQLESLLADTDLFHKAFVDAFNHTDTQLLKKNTSIDGSTALLIWFVGNNPSNLSFFVLNLGDSRAVLCRNGQAIPLSVDHKPNLSEERVRIQKAGGFVGDFGGIFRVYSSAGAGLSVQSGELKTFLAVSRAFGDQQLKTPSRIVSCEPDVKRFQVQSDDLFVVMACDGVWDVLSNQQAVDIALEHYKNPNAAANALIKQAYLKGSADNLTATVIQFGWRDEQAEEALSHLRKRTAPTTVRLKQSARRSSTNDRQEEIDMFSS